MTTKTIKKLADDCGKQDEIDFFNEVAESVPGNSYLKDFFRRDLVTWVETQIRSDFPPDVWDYWTGDQRELSTALANNRVEEAEFKKDLKSLEDAGKHYQEKADHWKSLYEDMNSMFDQQVRNNHELQRYNAELEAELEKTRATIQELKAEVYDLMKGAK